MVKHKKKRSRQSFVSKAMNVGLIALGFSRVITLAFQLKWGEIVHNATFGLAGNPETGQASSFDLDAGLAMYSPAAAAGALGFLKRYLLHKFPVR